MNDKGISEILIFGFGLGTLWDFITTFLGVITIIGGPNFAISLDNLNPNSFGVYGIAVVGATIVFCFNLITVNVWEDAREGTWTLVLPWFPCVVFDFCTSLSGNYKFILPSRQNEISVVAVVWFVTLLTTISPMSLRYLVKNYGKC